MANSYVVGYQILTQAAYALKYDRYYHTALLRYRDRVGALILAVNIRQGRVVIAVAN